MSRKLAFAAVAGRNKEDRRGACQDAVFGKSLNGISCIALADGAGSRRLSGTGARKTVRVVVDHILAHFDLLFEQTWRGDRKEATSYILNLISTELSSDRFSRRGSLEDYACTLIFAATDDDRMLLGHLGDGVAFLVDAQSVEISSQPDNGEFANETYFFTAHDAVEHFRLTATKLEAPVSILLASDGAAVSLLRRADQAVAPAVRRLCEWTASRPRRQMNTALKANLEGVFLHKTIDDCSIAIMADPRLHENRDS
ncbi:PP2C family serine/threonine-protein phosphatase [Pseudogemmobacter sonorensis]|uniref:PP2C family serine/threonine-protein phosphatase n=1 Tax=Pseudogemmobacter sonorensis TaxID=2989681 RepID=UPI0036A77D11